MSTPRKSKNPPIIAIHKGLGIQFEIVGSRHCGIGPCFCVVQLGEPASRERIFHVDMFDREDFPAAVRNALFTALQGQEEKRVAYQKTKAHAQEKAADARRRAKEDAEDNGYWIPNHDLGADSSAEYEPENPLEPIEDESEIISDEDTEGHESFEEEEVEELVEED